MKNGNERSIQSLDRAFDIMDVLGQADSKGLSLKDICAATGLHPSTTHHLLSTMVARGYLSQDPDSRRYMLGPTLLRMRSAALDRLDLQSIAYPFARELLARSSESVYVSVLRGWEFPALIMLPSPHPIRFVRPTGPLPSLHAAASGKCLMAYQPAAVLEQYMREFPLTAFTPNTIVEPAALREEMLTIRAMGIAFDREERTIGASCVAAPIFNDRGSMVAALSLSAPTFRAIPTVFAQWAAHVRELAAALSGRLGYSPGASAEDRSLQIQSDPENLATAS
jgi:DNA-binding IclR family transcriptional regulator